MTAFSFLGIKHLFKGTQLMASVIQHKHANPRKSLPMQHAKLSFPLKPICLFKESTTKAHTSIEPREPPLQVIKSDSWPGTKQITLNKTSADGSFLMKLMRL